MRKLLSKVRGKSDPDHTNGSSKKTKNAIIDGRPSLHPSQSLPPRFSSSRSPSPAKAPPSSPAPEKEKGKENEKEKYDPSTPTRSPTAPPEYSWTVSAAETSQTTKPRLNRAFLAALATLSPTERLDFAQPFDVLAYCVSLDSSQENHSSTRRLMSRVKPVLEGVNRYMSIVKTAVQHSPEISSLAVGGVMLVLKVAIDVAGFFDGLLGWCEEVGRECEWLAVYAEGGVWDEKTGVMKALERTYKDLLEFCCLVRRIFKDERWALSRVVLHSLFDPYQPQFDSILRSFKENAALVSKHATAQDHLTFELRNELTDQRRSTKDQEQRKQKRGACLKYLDAEDYEVIHARHHKKRHGHSGQWLLDSEEYHNWLSRPSGGLLWCYGNPGVGKTVLASIVVEDLRSRVSTPESGAVFAYASYKDTESSGSPLRFLATFVLQLSRQRAELFPELEAYYDANVSDARPHTFIRLQEVFLQIIRNLRTVYLVVDALDEIEVKPRKEFLQFLSELVPEENGNEGSSGCAVKVFVTSRKERDIEKRFSKRPCMQIQATKVASDIDSFIHDELEKRISSGDLHLDDDDDELKEKIFTTLSTQAGGMFLWARYQLDHICHESAYGRASLAITELPETMDATYAHILLKIHKQPPSDRKRARKILQWVAFARQPLTLEQIATAIGVDPSSHRKSKDVPIILSPWKPILDITGNLLAVDDANVINFTHYSAKEYLTRTDAEKPDSMSPADWEIIQRYFLKPDEAHEDMFAICLTYMCFPEFERFLDYEESGGSTYGIDAWVEESKFVRYSARWWNYHMEELAKAGDGVLNPTVEKMLKEVLVPGSRKLWNLMNTYLNMRAKRDPGGWTLHTEATYFLTFCHPRTLSYLLTFQHTGRLMEGVPHFNPSRQPIQIPDYSYRALTRFLLRRLTSLPPYIAFLSDPFLPHHLPTHLRIASSIRRTPFVSHLLSLPSVSPNLPDTQGKFPLAAVTNKRVTRYRSGIEILNLLLKHGADPNVVDARYGPPLIGAVVHAVESPSYTQGTTMAELLLGTGANVNAFSSCCPPPAAKAGRQTERCYGTALTAACKVAAASTVTYSSVAISVIKLLLDARWGADINLPCIVHGTPLMVTVLAAVMAPPGSGERGCDLTKQLLENGADPNYCHPQKGSILAAAANLATVNGRKDGPAKRVMGLLVDYGGDVNRVDDIFGFPLIAVALASKRRRGPGLELLKWLLDQGADPNLLIPGKGTALCVAAEVAAGDPGRRVKALEVLLNGGARVRGEEWDALEAAKKVAVQAEGTSRGVIREEETQQGEGGRGNFVVRFLEGELARERGQCGVEVEWKRAEEGNGEEYDK